MNDKGQDIYINVSTIDRRALLRRSNAEAVRTTILLNKKLKELVQEKIRDLKSRGFDISLNALIHYLLIAFLDSEIIIDSNNINININKIEIRNNSIERNDVCIHTHMHTHMHTSGKRPVPDLPKELVARANNILKKRLSLDKNEYIRLLEDLLEAFLKYKENPLAQYYIDILRWELEH